MELRHLLFSSIYLAPVFVMGSPLSVEAGEPTCIRTQVKLQTEAALATSDEIADGNRALDAIIEADSRSAIEQFKNSKDRQTAWGERKSPLWTPEREQIVLSEFKKDGRAILIAADTNRRQTAGTVFVFRVLKSYIEKMTDGAVTVRIADADQFRRGWDSKSSELQNIRAAFPTQKEIAQMMKGIQAVHIATEGPVGAAFRLYCLRKKIPFTTAYHTMRPELVQNFVEGKVRAWGNQVNQVATLLTQGSLAHEPLSPYLIEGLAKRVGVSARGLTVAILRRFHGRSDAQLVPTPTLAKHLIENDYDADILYEWAHGVELDIFKIPTDRSRQSIRQELYRDAGDSAIAVCAGRISEEKNLVDFFDAQLPNTKKYVIGSGPEDLVNHYKRAYPDVVFLGNKDHNTELPLYMYAADDFWFTSVKDTFGLVNVESLAMGTPVVGYSVQGLADILTSPDAGRAVRYDPTDRAGNLRRLEQAHHEALTLDRHRVHQFGVTWDWRYAVLSFMHRLTRLP